MTTSEWVQIILMGVLVVVTGIYAWRTFAISKSSKKQADASINVAEVMKKQLMAARPFVIPDIDVHGNQNTYVENMRDLAQSHFPVAITNVGAATAIELELFLIAPKGNPISTKLPLLLQGGSWRNKLTYVCEFNENGGPIFDMPPPEGRYELKVKFRSAVAEEDMQFSEVTLPFDLHRGWGVIWRIERHELHREIKE